MDSRTELASLRAPKAHFVAALARVGARRQGRTDRYTLASGATVVLHKRGHDRYALAFTDALDAFWADSVTASVLACYEAGDVVTVRA